MLLFFAIFISSASGQQRLQFHVLDFSLDPFDTSASDGQYKKRDGSGYLYAIVKVQGSTPDEDLREYRFSFGNMNHLVEDHDGQLWLYVQKNAKTVTISRDGYVTVRHHDLGYTIESGKVYKMVLSAQGPIVYTQMVMFSVTPPDSKAMVTVTREGDSQSREVFGTIDETGSIAKNMEFGTYTYEVMAENYHSSEGRFTLGSQSETHVEKVTLRSNGATVVLDASSDADIYVNGTKRGTRRWTGILKAGNYTVECRQANHRPSLQTISVEEGNDRTYQLTAPTPITGILSVNSRPLAANIRIDGKDYGTTPRNITDILIGHHTIVVSKDGYAPKTEEFDIRENETSTLELTMEKSQTTVTPPLVNTSAADKTFTVGGVSFTMKAVAGGTFTMGATSEQGIEALRDEKPAHHVTLSDYYIGQTEVTQALWQAVMGTTVTQQRDKANTSWPLKGVGSNYPMYYISWDDCQEFIRKLNSMTGQKFRLPTEAEWEYAARGGNKSKGYKYSGSNNIDDVAWYKNNSSSSTHDVKTQQPNELGIYDMSGNVFEWCNDWYGSYSSSAQTNPTGPSKGSLRVLRGGSWCNDAWSCRVSNRSDGAPVSRVNFLGLRLALDEETTADVPLNMDQQFQTTTTPPLANTSVGDKTFTVGGVSFTMKAVAGGTFTMGATSEQGGDAGSREEPAHRVTLSDYYIGETEVTQALWQAVMGSNPSYFEGSNLPVETVSWDDCQEFIRKLNSMTGQKFRLPTEAEWEYAARGGNKSKGYKYSGSNKIESVSWYLKNSRYRTNDVKTKQPNELGIYDMSGNVWEWCQDWYGSYSSSAQTNPTGPSTGSRRVRRGGSWYFEAWDCRVSNRRDSKAPGRRTDNLGLRLAL